jgi:hypothetical protein
MDNDEKREGAHNERQQFMEHVKAKTPTVVTLDKGKHVGKQMNIVAVSTGPYSLEYWGIVGNRKVAVMLTSAPIGGLAQVTSSQVAHSFWRCGIANHIYSEIMNDLHTVGATLEPHWRSMTPDAARFWKTLRTDSADVQDRVTATLQEMESAGRITAHDELKEEDLSQFWNGESTSKKKREKLGIDTTPRTR